MGGGDGGLVVTDEGFQVAFTGAAPKFKFNMVDSSTSPPTEHAVILKTDSPASVNIPDAKPGQKYTVTMQSVGEPPDEKTSDESDPLELRLGKIFC